jgi:hypothetical protein
MNKDNTQKRMLSKLEMLQLLKDCQREEADARDSDVLRSAEIIQISERCMDVQFAAIVEARCNFEIHGKEIFHLQADRKALKSLIRGRAICAIYQIKEMLNGQLRKLGVSEDDLY